MPGLILNKRKARFAGGPRAFSKKLLAMQAASTRRQAMPGYPIETAFTEPDAVWAYLHGDVITCLRCGKSYKALASHLRVHDGWTEARYKKHYGLPWQTGLTCESTKKYNRENGLKRVAEGIAFGGHAGDRTNLEKARAAPRRPMAPYCKIVAKMNNAKHRHSKVWHDADYRRVAGRMKQQDRTMGEVCNDVDLPGREATRGHAHRHADFARLLKATTEALSFHAQARAQQLGDCFFREASRLRRQGLSARQIADRLGVNKATVNCRIRDAPRQ